MAFRKKKLYKTLAKIFHIAVKVTENCELKSYTSAGATSVSAN